MNPISSCISKYVSEDNLDLVWALVFVACDNVL